MIRRTCDKQCADNDDISKRPKYNCSDFRGLDFKQIILDAVNHKEANQEIEQKI
jgi:hypothetical protein